jgi:protein gp37
MSNQSKIEWTDATWTPIRARVKDDAAAIAKKKGYTSLVQIAEKMAGHVGPHCEHVSDGCGNCYSETNNERCLTQNGTGLPFDRRSRDLVDIFLDEKILRQPLHWKKARNVFVCSQTDLFGEWTPRSFIDRMINVMAWENRHTYQILTKRGEAMFRYCDAMQKLTPQERAARIVNAGLEASGLKPVDPDICGKLDWPLPNVWWGVSAEDEENADARIPWLRKMPAALRFVSYEPALGPIFRRGPDELRGLNWVIIGGESGPGARPFDIEWARNTIAQCKAAGVACFVKQLGAAPGFRLEDEERRGNMAPSFHHCDRATGLYVKKLKDRKGGDMSEWPIDIRVREYPR